MALRWSLLIELCARSFSSNETSGSDVSGFNEHSKRALDDISVSSDISMPLEHIHSRTHFLVKTKLHEFLESHTVRMIVILLICLDVIAVCLELAISSGAFGEVHSPAPCPTLADTHTDATTGHTTDASTTDASTTSTTHASGHASHFAPGGDDGGGGGGGGGQGAVVRRVSAVRDAASARLGGHGSVPLSVVVRSGDSHGNDTHAAHGHVNERLERAEKALHWFSITLLCVFLVENILMCIALGRHFFTFFHIFDFCVVVTSLILELTLDAEKGAGLIVILRLVRIVQGVVAAEKESHNKTQERLRHSLNHNKHLRRLFKAVLMNFEESDMNPQFLGVCKHLLHNSKRFEREIKRYIEHGAKALSAVHTSE